MDESPNPKKNEKPEGATGPFFTVWMKKRLPGASPGPWLEMLSKSTSQSISGGGFIGEGSTHEPKVRFTKSLRYLHRLPTEEPHLPPSAATFQLKNNWRTKNKML
jgi:hypothetical protein